MGQLRKMKIADAWNAGHSQVSARVGETWPQKWRKTQLELEGLFFYEPWPALVHVPLPFRFKVDLPWHVMLAQRWPLSQLLALLGRGLSILAEVPNLCDQVGPPGGALRGIGSQSFRGKRRSGQSFTNFRVHLVEETLS